MSVEYVGGNPSAGRRRGVMGAVLTFVIIASLIPALYFGRPLIQRQIGLATLPTHGQTAEPSTTYAFVRAMERGDSAGARRYVTAACVQSERANMCEGPGADARWSAYVAHYHPHFAYVGRQGGTVVYFLSTNLARRYVITFWIDSQGRIVDEADFAPPQEAP